jgi:hypothetical protein
MKHMKHVDFHEKRASAVSYARTLFRELLPIAEKPHSLTPNQVTRIRKTIRILNETKGQSGNARRLASLCYG